MMFNCLDCLPICCCCLQAAAAASPGEAAKAMTTTDGFLVGTGWCTTTSLADILLLLLPLTGTCRRFSWGGCQGNDNNFASEQRCMTTCAAAMADVAARSNSRTGLQASPPASNWAPAPWNTEQMPDAWIVDGTAKQGAPAGAAPQASSAGGLGDVQQGSRVMVALMLAVLLMCVVMP
jgi:hypothetical protein